MQAEPLLFNEHTGLSVTPSSYQPSTLRGTITPIADGITVVDERNVRSAATTANSTATSAQQNNIHRVLYKIVESIESIKAVQNQHSIQIDQILRIVSNQQTISVSADAPDDFPGLPLQRKADFKNMELFLQKEDSYNYMVGIIQNKKIF